MKLREIPEYTTRCICLISQTSEQYYVQAPLIMLVEAKNNDTKEGIAHCAAEMIAAQVFNQAKNSAIEEVYGVVTTGSLWKFLKLAGNFLTIDSNEVHISTPGILLGILMKVVMPDGQTSKEK